MGTDPSEQTKTQQLFLSQLALKYLTRPPPDRQKALIISIYCTYLTITLKTLTETDIFHGRFAHIYLSRILEWTFYIGVYQNSLEILHCAPKQFLKKLYQISVN